MVDITQLKVAKESLKKSEEHFRALVEKSGIAISIDDEEGNLIYCNSRYADIFGYSMEEVRGQPISAIVHSDDVERVMPYHTGRLHGKDVPSRYEFRGIRKDGSVIYLEVDVSVLREGERLIGTRSYMWDITERKRAQEKIKDLAKFPSENPFPVLRLDKDGVILYANEASDGLLQHWGCAVGSYAPTFWLDLVAEALSSQSRRTIEIKFGEQTYSFEVVPILDAGYVNLYGSKITERKRAEEALKESAAKLQAVFNTVGTGIIIIDRDTQIIIEANQTAMEMTGLPKKRIIGQICHSLVCPAQAGKCPIKDLGQSVDNSERKLIHADGHLKDILKTVYPITIKGKDCYVESFIDITERKRAEEELRESEEKYRTLVETSAEAIFIAQDGMLKFVNRMASEMTGYSMQELLSSPFLEFIHPDDRDMVGERYLRRLAGDVSQPRYAFRLVSRDGSIKWVEIDAVRVDWEGKPATLNFLSDITERNQAEEEIRRKAKELEEKNDELNRFTHAVSHDLRSPLVTIQTFQGHLERDIRSQDAARVEKDLGYIRNAADKMGRLLDDLRRFLRVGRSINPSEEAPLQAIVKEALDLVAGRITARGVRIDLTEEPVVLYGDRTRLVEVFMNLVDNAVKFMGDQPAPRVEIGVEQAGEELVLHVRDNGIGIDPELQPLVFGLFHKLDPGSEGEGIGSALVRRIVELHGGRIWVESEGPGKGATFRFTLAKTRRNRAEEEKP